MILRIRAALVLTLATISMNGCGIESHSSASQSSATAMSLVNRIDLGQVLPDLVITEIFTGWLRTTPENKILPFSVTVKNQSFMRATGFKVSVTYATTSGSEYAVAFNVPGQTSLWYPRTPGLNGDDSITFRGTLLFRRDLTGPIKIKALVDSCAGEELSSDFCHVKEGREDNNYSAPVSVTL